MKRRVGGMAVTATVIALAGLVLVNLLAGLLTDRFYLKADITTSKLYELSSDTTDLLQAMDEDIVMYCIHGEADARNTYGVFIEFMEKYVALSGGSIRLEFRDPTLNPNLKDEFNLASVAAMDIVIKNNRTNQVRQITTSDYFSTSDNSFQLEQKITGALVNVTAEKSPRVVFTSGHGEQYESFGVLRETFHSSGFTSSTLNLVNEEIPEDTEVLVICYASSDFSSEEIAKLEAYRQRGGDFLYLTFYEEIKNVQLWLGEWGIELQNRQVMDSLQNYMYPQMVIPNIAEGDVFTGLSSGINPVAQMPRSLGILFNQRSGYTVQALLTTSSSSYARDTDSESSSTEKTDEDISGPLNISLMSTYSTYVNNELVESNLLVMPAYFLIDNMLNYNTFLNNEMAGSMVRFFNPDGVTVVIPGKDVSSPALNLVGIPAIMVMVLLVIVIPVALLILGLVLWLRRRNL